MSIIAELLGTARYLCRGGEGKKMGGQSYFRLARRGGLNFFIKKFRGGQQLDRKVYFPNFQIFFLFFVPVTYLTIVTEFCPP